MNQLICILGTTATGKTQLAVSVAEKIDAEVISADSRQVYRGMDIGTGKDLEEYSTAKKNINYHLIDIADAGEEYNVFRFKKDFDKAFDEIASKGKKAILCGGSGMYIEAVLNNYKLDEVPVNRKLRTELEQLDNQQLIDRLKSIRTLHNTTDISDRQRCIRAIEIEEYYRRNKSQKPEKSFDSLVFGIKFDRQEIRKRIKMRLEKRLQEGMIEEVERLMKRGVSKKMLKFYGLEYRYITLYLEGQLTYNQMFEKLNIAIGQFAKRQETWWRRMEKRGTLIHWIEGEKSLEEKTSAVLEVLKTKGFY